MPVALVQSLSVTKRLHKLLRPGLLLCLACALCAGTLRAQTDGTAKYNEALKLFNEAAALYQQGQKAAYEEAVKKFAAALPVFHELGKTAEEAGTLAYLGNACKTLGEPQQALNYFAQALPLHRQRGDKTGAADDLNALGDLYFALGEKQRALDSLTQATALYHGLGDAAGEGVTLYGIGRIYETLGDNQKAVASYTQALALAQRKGEAGAEALLLRDLGNVSEKLDDTRKAEDYYEQSVARWRAAGDRKEEVETLNELVGLSILTGAYWAGIEYCTHTLPLYKALGDRAGEARAQNLLGRLVNLIGDHEAALEYLNRALSLWRALADRSGEAETLNNLGNAQLSMGDSQKALDYYTQAQTLAHEAADAPREAAALAGIGSVYTFLGDHQKAFDYFNQSLALARNTKYLSLQAQALLLIGDLYLRTGQNRKGLDYALQALPLFHALRDRRNETLILSDLAVAYGGLGEHEKALDYFKQALVLTRPDDDDRANEVLLLNNISNEYLRVGDNLTALDYLTKAERLLPAVGRADLRALTLFNVAFAESLGKELPEALKHIEAALTIIEAQRGMIRNNELRTAFFATKQSYYEFYIDLLMRLHKQQPNAGYDGKALQAAERARARTLLEMLAEAGADIRQGIDPHLLARERALQQQLNAKGAEQIKVATRPHTDEEAARVAHELDALTSEFQQLQTQIRETSPHYAALMQPQPLTLKEIQTQVLDAETILLEYSLGTDHSFLWVVTPTALKSYELPKREEIERAARAFYDAVHAPPKPAAQGGLATELQQEAQPQSEQATQTAARLSRLLLGPAATLLGKKRLLIVADGALQYVPFAALSLPTDSASNAAPTPLIVEHEIVTLPSASTLAVLRREVGARQSASKTLAVLADPIFERTDARLKQSAGQVAANTIAPTNANTSADAGRNLGLGLGVAKAAQDAGVATTDLQIPRLPATRREADAISQLAPAAFRREALDFAANRSAATDPALADYRFIHFATHGFLDSEHPELSGLLLSMYDQQGRPQDGFLRAHEIFNLKLNADVVVLSACQTGLGKEIKGEGLVGLTRGFMYAGAPRVVVSLWSVSDAATAELMTRFYKGMLVEHLRPAQALQAAQVSMLQDRRFSAPFYWAAFTLQGEWR